MKYVEIPLNIAQRAARKYRPILPYVRKFIASQRQIIDPKEFIDLSDFAAEEYRKLKENLESKTVNELKNEYDLDFKGLKKDEMIDKILTEERK